MAWTADSLTVACRGATLTTDGDLDILASGTDSDGQYQLRVYRNNANGTFDPVQIEVDSLNGGIRYGGLSWGDCDNDGDLDILVSGQDAFGPQLRVYRNNGNGTFDPAQVEVKSPNGGNEFGSVSWGDFDNDGDLDIVVSGQRQLRFGNCGYYQNNGNRDVRPGASRGGRPERRA